MTAPLTAPIRPEVDDGDHDRFAHYVRKTDALRALVEGIPCTALCGKTWVPTRLPENYPVCPTCQQIHDAMFGDAA